MQHQQLSSLLPLFFFFFSRLGELHHHTERQFVGEEFVFLVVAIVAVVFVVAAFVSTHDDGYLNTHTDTPYDTRARKEEKKKFLKKKKKKVRQKELVRGKSMMV